LRTAISGAVSCRLICRMRADTFGEGVGPTLRETSSDMRGQDILVRTMSVPTRRGVSSQEWQYHSRSDAHSKIACWTLLFDLLTECDAARRLAARGELGFGINHVVVGPINKTLDLVLTRVAPNRPPRQRTTFAQLADKYSICLSAEDVGLLDQLPLVESDVSEDYSEVVVALEAKACMTEHVKSLPRLHAEILATGYLAKRAMPRCIAVSYTLVNAAASFVTPSGLGKRNVHKQPESASGVLDMIASAIPLSRDMHNLLGYDVVGTTVVRCANDGSPVALVTTRPAPDQHSPIRYERMIASLCGEFRARFPT